MSKKIINNMPEVLVGVLLFVILFSWGVVQSIETQPDELTRYMIPFYIFSNWKLPNGNLEELLVRGYGISYGFFPCLPYIFMAPAMKIVSLFTSNSFAILMGARTVNFIAGVVTYIYVRKLSKELFENIWTGWLFTLIICFWPQVLFIFTYTNCDAFAFMSCAIMSYAIVRALKCGWDRHNILTLSIGVSICLLSYFNAYGMILGSVILFVLSYVKAENGKLSFDFRQFLKVGLIIAGITIILSGWWFIRNAILYDGDFIGMTANRICSEKYAVDYLKPSMKDVIKNNGGSIFDLLRDSSYMFLLKQSFFGRFGNMDIAAPNYMIRFLKLFMLVGAVGLFVPTKKRLFYGMRRIAFDIGMIVAAFTPVFLTFYYSYANDYQPQGRYMLPGLIPLMCILFIGINNIQNIKLPEKIQISKHYDLVYKCVCTGVFIYIALMTVGCVYIIMQNYLPNINETFSLVYTGNLYE